MMHHPSPMGPIEARIRAAAQERKRRWFPPKRPIYRPPMADPGPNPESVKPIEIELEYTAPVERVKRQRSVVPKDEIRALANVGYPHYQIANLVGCSASAVSRLLRGDRGGKSTRRTIAEYEARIEALLDEGMTQAGIAGRFGFCPSTVSKFIAAKGWQRE